MQAQNDDGAIINMASATPTKAENIVAAYSSAKHGVVSLTPGVALENGEHDIRINASAPGAVSTEMTLNTLATMGTSQEKYATRVGLLNRFSLPAEIA
ncbi:uncharacterized protein N7511_001374 [Penicillium nucicola]|uniref:uncharacterized protein n=1 Tax=Penicillium nucicola TaxID=1850975 RepID=UPI0025453EE5|nr:uncharacterized protein N7511_001374 [Penicillium nucicola]KAJ5776363.1 hypothetical protein N7511_001374 [Penicillium nucicola]